MHACDMTLTYLRDGLSTCSVVWVSVQYVFIKFIQLFDATMQKFLLKALKTTAHTFFFRSFLRLRNPFWGCLPVALVCDFEFWPKNDDF